MLRDTLGILPTTFSVPVSEAILSEGHICELSAADIPKSEEIH